MEPSATNANTQNMRVLPHNIEAEQSLLGVIMLDNTAYEDVGDFLSPNHFYQEINAKIYKAIGSLLAQNQVADPITLSNYLSEDNKDKGITSYLLQLVDGVISIAGAGDYARLIYDLHLRRQLILTGERISYDAQKSSLSGSVEDQIQKAEAAIYELSLTGQTDHLVSFETASVQTMSVIERAYKNSGSLIGITTGFTDLDHMLGGLAQSDLIILAGRPSMGKTALATNIAFKAALAKAINREGGGNVLFFSLEMSTEQLVSRILSQECEIPSEKIRRGELSDNDYISLQKRSQQLSNLKLFIEDTPALSVSSIRTRARRLKRREGLDLIVIDYLQLLQGNSNSRNENRVQEISDITRSLKTLAKELDIPVLALSQLSRAVESREDKRPQLSDLRESGSIEQDADIVLFVYREEYYEERKMPGIGDEDFEDKLRRWQNRMAKVHNIAEVIVAKQRHGRIGTVKLYFDGKFTKFDNLSDDRKSYDE